MIDTHHIEIMQPEILNLITTTALSLIYLIGATKSVQPVFSGIIKPLNNATGILFLGTILGFGINLLTFSNVASSAFYYHLSQQELLKGLMYWTFLAGLSFVFSYLTFRLSFSLVGLTTPENEKEELAKDNITLAGLHVVVYIIICLVVSHPLADYANTFISYPQFPS